MKLQAIAPGGRCFHCAQTWRAVESVAGNGCSGTRGVRVFKEETIPNLATPSEQAASEEVRDVERRELCHRGSHRPSLISGERVILVDDGIVTGSAMRAGVAALRCLQPARIGICIPVALCSTRTMLKEIAGDAICPVAAADSFALAAWHKNFGQLFDEGVQNLLGNA